MLGTYDTAVIVAGLCTVLSVTLSLHLIRAHLRNYVKPQRQRYVIRILWMVPIYAGDSFLSLCFIRWAVYFEVPRDAYESYILYNFVALLVDYMGGEDAAKAFFAAQPPQKHWWPFGWMGDHDMSVFLETCRLCTLQYSIVRPATGVVTLFFEWNNTYDDGDFTASSAYLWLMILNNLSVTLALYYLVYFYHASLPCASLQRASPLAKFLAIKAVVFFCFWQYCAISILASLGVVDRQLAHRSSDATTTGLNDFVVCVEMALFAVVHEFVFSASEHLEDVPRGATFNPLASVGAAATRGSADWDAGAHGGAQRALSYEQAYRDMFFVGDVFADVARIARESPAVVYRGFSRVNHARRERDGRRAEKRAARADGEGADGFAEAGETAAAGSAVELPDRRASPTHVLPSDLASPDAPRSPANAAAPETPESRPAPDADDPDAAWWSTV